jgi:hypothetical protein
MRPHVTVGKRYRMEDGEIEVDSIEQIGFPDITPALARESGFLGLVDLLKVAKHGKGENLSGSVSLRESTRQPSNSATALKPNDAPAVRNRDRMRPVFSAELCHKALQVNFNCFF